MARAYNFSAGPATLPLEVLEQARTELLDWHDIGMSIIEISHRSKEFLAVAHEAETDLRELLDIPSHYQVLFLQGGARSQFAMVPMNLLRGKDKADYLDIGIWSHLALTEAKRYCQVNTVASTKDSLYQSIPPQNEWSLDPEAAYFHYVDNETINGVEFAEPPDLGGIPLVSDMSSNILSRTLDINKFSLIYAGAQKNIGPAGLTLVIVKDSLIGEALPFTPSMFNYALHAQEGSMYNTPPTFAWYMAGLTFKWLKARGGLQAIEKLNRQKSNLLYNYIDGSEFYGNTIDPRYRSRMNVIFSLRDDRLDSLFLEEAAKAGLKNLKGHKLVGAMRASLYNAMPLEGIEKLINFMDDFAKRHG